MSVRISGSKLNVYNPSSGKEMISISITSKQELQEILVKANQAANHYKYASFSHRKKMIRKFRKGIVKRMDEFIEIICNETGKKEIEALMEIFIALEPIMSELNPGKNINPILDFPL